MTTDAEKPRIAYADLSRARAEALRVWDAAFERLKDLPMGTRLYAGSDHRRIPRRFAFTSEREVSMSFWLVFYIIIAGCLVLIGVILLHASSRNAGIPPLPPPPPPSKRQRLEHAERERKAWRASRG